MNALGDFQTPPALAALVIAAAREFGGVPARVLEPTCGSGAFVEAAVRAFPDAEVVGIEYQRARYGSTLAALERAHTAVSIVYDNAYEVEYRTLRWRRDGPLLIVGNPPWITAAALGRLPGSVLQPPRSNPKRLRGLAARTGAANFDVAEFLILKLLRDFGAEPILLALLVKESVARNVLATACATGLNIAAAEIVRIDARRWFGVAVDACCLLVSTAPQGILDAPIPIRSDFAGKRAGWFVTDHPAPAVPSSIVFRQGIKHDAADVFELQLVEGVWRNGYGEVVDVEASFVYPLLKARALHAGSTTDPKALIVPQTRLGEATAELERAAPLLYRYLCAHAGRLVARKSSIYRNAPPFALFGIGPYSFAPWKVAVAGLYAHARFRVLGPQAGRPVVLGDTSYFAAFEAEADARAFAALCTSPALAIVLAERVLPGKRPITKALLDGIDWLALAEKMEPASDRLRDLLRESPTV